MITYLAKLYLSSFVGVPKVVQSLLFTVFINAAGQMFLLFISLYLHSINYPVTLISVALTSYSIGGLIGSYVGGILVERFQFKVLSFSLFLSSVLLILIPLLDNHIKKISIIFILGLSHNIFKPASIYLLVNNINETNKVRLLGLRRVAVNLGMSVASLIGGWLSKRGYHYIFWIESFFSLLALIMLLISSRNRISLNNVGLQEPETQQFKSQWIIVIYLILLLNVIVFAQLFFTYPLFLKENYGIDSDLFARLFTLSGILILLFEVPILSYITKYHQILILGLGSVLLCNGLSIISFFQQKQVIYISAVAWTIGEIIFFPTSLNLILCYSQKTKQGQNIGIYQFIYSLGLFLGPVIGGILYPFSNAIWYGCAGISLISCSIFVLFSIIANPLNKRTMRKNN